MQKNSILMKFFLILLSFTLIGIFLIDKFSKTHLDLAKSSKSPQILNAELDLYLKLNLNPLKLCTFKQKIHFAFVYVFSSAKNFERREAIRKTWANKSSFQQIRVGFILGQTNQHDIQSKLAREQAKNNDLIQANFLDSYRNLSYKSLTAWKWISFHCSNAKYLIKVDDDVILNTFVLMSFLKDSQTLLKKNSHFLSSFMCKYWVNAYPNRNEKSKFFVKPEEYNENLYGMTSYPAYCAGMGFIMSTDLAKKLLAKAYELKVFWIDDVYVGLLSNRVGVNFIDGAFLHTYKSSIQHTYVKRVLFVNDCAKNEDFYQIWRILSKKLARK